MVKHIENEDQIALRRWLTAGLCIPEVVNLHGNAKYLLNNMIAKYTLAASTYALSESAERTLLERGVDFKKTYSRGTFYGKQGGRNPFIYEHAVPAGVLRAELLRANGNKHQVKEILQGAGPVAVLLREEDNRLQTAGLRSQMPSGWRLGDDPLARYHTVNIKLSAKSLNMKGAIYR
jgi:hypothetical protein